MFWTKGLVSGNKEERERERGDRYAGRRLPIPKENENMAY
jgi:hypothetical protein